MNSRKNSHSNSMGKLPKIMERQMSNSQLQQIPQLTVRQSQDLSIGDAANFMSLNSSMVSPKDSMMYNTPGNKKGRKTKFRLLEAKKELQNMNHNQMTPNTNRLKQSSQSLNPKQLIKQSHTNLLKVEDEDEEKDKEESKNLMQVLQDSFENEPEDQKKKSVIGDHAVQEYFRMHKKNIPILQENIYHKLPNSSQTAMSIFSTKNLLIPCKIGLIKRKGQEDTINIKNMKYGDKYANMLSEGLQQNKRNQDISDYQLSGNKITQLGANNLLKTISKNAKFLDLSNNNIGQIGCGHISLSLSLKDCRIEYLNLEDNKLGDQAIMQITKAVQKNKSLKYLNLSKNYISDRVAESIADFVVVHPTLEELYLHWNQLTAVGGKCLFESFLENDMLKVLDLSCNSLGISGSCIDEICEFLQKCVNIVHLDLSNNYFNLPMSKSISQALEQNKTIYGFHFSGNYGYVDNRGFLVINETQEDKDLTGMYVKSRIDGCKTLQKQIYRTERDFELVDCCWICEGWQEHEFKWDNNSSGQNIKDPLFINFNFEDYRTNYLGKQSGDEFIYNRVLPPGENTYFYVTGEDFDQHICAQDHKIKSNPDQKIIQDIGVYDNTLIDIEIQKINTITIQKNMNVINQEYKPNLKMKPRTRDPQYKPPKKLKKRDQWTFPISLMYKWKPDTDDLIKKCFQFDWSNSRIPRIVKKEEELEEIREFLESKYKHIKGAYKYFASINPAQDIWGIQNAAFWEFINKISLIDQNVTQEHINLKQVAVMSNSQKGNPRDFEKAIMRYQMMELLVRLANEKYIDRLKSTTSTSEALKMLWDEHLENVMGDTSNIYLDQMQKWREENYWNEHCDYVLKHYKKIVDHVYKKYSKKKVKPGQAPFMCLDELQHIIIQADLPSCEHFGTEVGYFAFNLSMMTQVNELEQNRIFEMSIVEFYEALARLADKANFEPHPTLQEELGDFNWPYEKRKKTKLGWRLEGLCLRLLDTVCDPAFKYAYPKIEKSFFCRPDDWADYEN